MPQRFADFVPLPENRSARLALRRLERAVSAVVGSRKRLPPLYLHGEPGSGKSHLVASVLAACRSAVVKIIPAHELGRLYLKSPAEQLLERGELERADLLAIEDLQFLSAEAADALAALLDRRQSRCHYTITTGSCGPAALNIPNRLRSRLTAGFVVHLPPMGTESRRLLAEKLCARRKLRVADEVLNYLAARGPGARSLVGELSRLAVLGKIYPPPLKLAQLVESSNSGNRPTSPGKRIIGRIAAHYGIDEKKLEGKARHRNVVWPRQVAMFLLREVLRLPLVRIGELLGGRDHTTVMHAIDKVSLALANDAGASRQMRELQTQLESECQSAS